MTLPHLQLLSRHHCCLCEDAKPVLAAAAEQGLCSWETVNVDEDKSLLVRYGLDVPVLLHEGRELLRHRVSEDALRLALAGIAADRIAVCGDRACEDAV